MRCGQCCNAEKVTSATLAHASYSRRRLIGATRAGPGHKTVLVTGEGDVFMLTLSQDQSGLLEYLAEKVHELTITARAAAGTRADDLMLEAEELTAIRKAIIARAQVAEEAAQLQLPLDLKKAA